MRRKSRSKRLSFHLFCFLNTFLDFASVWVSTDDESLADLVSDYFSKEQPRIHIHMRSKQTATDTSSSLDAVKEFLKTKPVKQFLCSCQCCLLRSRLSKNVQLAPADSSKDYFGHRENVIAVTALIQCTSPILHFKHLQSVCQFMLTNSKTIHSVFSAFTDGTSLKWHQVTTSKKYKPVNFDPYNRPRRQNMNPGEKIQLNLN